MVSPITEIERALFGRMAPTPPTRPTIGVWDSGAEITIVAEVPGLTEKDIQVSVRRDVLTITSDRSVDLPEGYSVRGRERPGTRFSRSLRLGVTVDADRATATVRDGLLTITLPRPAEHAPRSITVKLAE